mgnify:FL=1
MGDKFVYLLVIVRDCGTDIWGVYATQQLAENAAESLRVEKNVHKNKWFDFCHVVPRPFHS